MPGPSSNPATGGKGFWHFAGLDLFSCPKSKRQTQLAALRKRRPSHVVLGSRVVGHRSRGSGFGLWRNRWCIGWNRKDSVLRLPGPAFGFPRHPFCARISRSLRRNSMVRKYSSSASKDVEREMHKFKRGQLKSGKGGKGGRVKSRKQAIAIGLSEARKKGKKVPKKAS